MSFFAFTCCSFNFDLACVINCMVVELGLLLLVVNCIVNLMICVGYCYILCLFWSLPIQGDS
jgi:hypothetical protein